LKRAAAWGPWVVVVLAAALTVSALLRLREGPRAHHPSDVLLALDRDGSGALEPAELDGRDAPGTSWRAHDLDDDGRLDARELEIALEVLDPRWLLRMPDEPTLPGGAGGTTPAAG